MNVTAEARRQSYRQILPNVATRQQAVLTILLECGAMTAREISIEMYKRGFAPSGERNFAAPRLTELRQAGKVQAIEKKPCTQTGRMVTVWRIAG